MQEVAFTLADGMTYVQAAIDKGLDVDTFAPRLSFFFASFSNFFEEIAKFRAARRMWARIMRDKFGGEESEVVDAALPYADGGIVAHGAATGKQYRAYGVAGAFGGAGRNAVAAYELVRRSAWRCQPSNQHALRCGLSRSSRYESGAAQTVDPIAGSYYVESLTDEIEKRAEAYLEKIDALGGMLKAIERGYVQQEIQNASYEFQQRVERLEQVVVGVNRFRLDEETPVPILRIDESLERKQVERLRALRAKRDAGVWRDVLTRIEDTARTGENLMPAIVNAVENYATVGEISDAMRKVFGEYKEAVVI